MTALLALLFRALAYWLAAAQANPLITTGLAILLCWYCFQVVWAVCGLTAAYSQTERR